MELDKETLQVVPLGGLGEIGKNMTAVRQDSGMILVDAGMSFPDEEMPGIDLVLPDFTYLREHAGELKGIVLTHGDRKSTRLNSSHTVISYAVFCLKKKKKK